MDEADFVEVFVIGEAAVGGLGGYVVIGVCCSVGKASFAPGVVGEPFDDGAAVVGDGAAEGDAAGAPGFLVGPRRWMRSDPPLNMAAYRLLPGVTYTLSAVPPPVTM